MHIHVYKRSLLFTCISTMNSLKWQIHLSVSVKTELFCICFSRKGSKIKKKKQNKTKQNKQTHNDIYHVKTSQHAKNWLNCSKITFRPKKRYTVCALATGNPSIITFLLLGYSRKIHTPPMDGMLEILAGGGLRALEIWAGGEASTKKILPWGLFSTRA